MKSLLRAAGSGWALLGILAAAETWTQDPAFAPVVEEPRASVGTAILPLAGGQYYAAHLGIIEGRAAAPWSRFNADGSWDPTFVPPAVEATLLCPLRSGGVIQFRRSDTGAQAGTPNLHRLTATGAIDPTFTPQRVSLAAPGRGAEDSAGRLLVWDVGAPGVNGVAAPVLVRFGPNGAHDAAFAAAIAAQNLLGVVDCVPLADGKIAAVVSAPGGTVLVRLAADGTREWTVPASARVTGLLRVLDDGRLLVSADRLADRDILRINPDGSVDAGYVPDLPETYRTILRVPGADRLYYTEDGPNAQTLVRRLNPDGTRDPTFECAYGRDQAVLAGFTQFPGGPLYAGGAGTPARAAESRGVTRLTATGAIDAAYGPVFRQPGLVQAFTVQADGKLVVAGRFSHVAGAAGSVIARFHADGTRDATFAPAFAATETADAVVALSDGSYVLAGQFATTAPGANLVRVLGDGRLDAAFRPPAGLVLLAAARSADTTVMVRTDSAPIRVHPLRADGTLDAGFAPPDAENAVVWAAAPGGDVYLVSGVGTSRLQHFRRDGSVVSNQSNGANPVFGQPLPLSNGRQVSVLQRTRFVPAVGDRPYLYFRTYDAADVETAADSGEVYEDWLLPTVLHRALGGTAAAFGATMRVQPWQRSHFVRGDGTAWSTVPNEDARGAAVRKFILSGTPADQVPRIVEQPAAPANAALPGDFRSFRVTATGAAPLAYQWQKNGVAVPGATESTLSLWNLQPADAGDYRCVVTNPHGAVTSETARLAVADLADLATFTARPAPQTVAPGAAVTLSAAATSAGAQLWSWYFNDSPSSLGSGSSLTLPNLNAAQSGVYRASLTVALGAGTYRFERSALVTVVPPGGTVGRMLGISTRCDVGAGNDTLVAGLAVDGPAPRRILIRGVGPGLRPYMGAGATLLADPEIEVFSVAAQSLFKNDDWEHTPAGAAAISGTLATLGLFPLEAGAKDAALLVDLAPGAYTVHLRDKSGGRGVGLVEFYEVGASGAAARLLGISSRARVRPGDGILIPGVVIEGSTPRRLLIRGLGPKLGEYGIGDHLPDPALKVLRLENGAWQVVAENDDWGTGAWGYAEAPVQTLAKQTGLSPLAGGSRDAALEVLLPPGVYTIQLGSGTGAPGNGTGVGLVEVYDVP